MLPEFFNPKKAEDHFTQSSAFLFYLLPFFGRPLFLGSIIPAASPNAK